LGLLLTAQLKICFNDSADQQSPLVPHLSRDE
jgi:hypothetical protein